jgi:hypothetical protein
VAESEYEYLLDVDFGGVDGVWGFEHRFRRQTSEQAVYAEAVELLREHAVRVSILRREVPSSWEKVEELSRAEHVRSGTERLQSGPGPGLRVDGLTVEEGVVADHLAEAVNAWGRLPREHPNELDEFVFAVHLCQGLLTTRIARRAFPDGWPVKT